MSAQRFNHKLLVGDQNTVTANLELASREGWRPILMSTQITGVIPMIYLVLERPA